jgi:hypothetical protein
VQVPLSSGGSQEPASDTAEVGRAAPELSGDRSAATKSSGNDGPAPALAEHWEPVSELAGPRGQPPSKGLSDRTVNRVRIRSTM